MELAEEEDVLHIASSSLVNTIRSLCTHLWASDAWKGTIRIQYSTHAYQSSSPKQFHYSSSSRFYRGIEAPQEYIPLPTTIHPPLLFWLSVCLSGQGLVFYVVQAGKLWACKLQSQLTLHTHPGTDFAICTATQFNSVKYYCHYTTAFPEGEEVKEEGGCNRRRILIIAVWARNRNGWFDNCFTTSPLGGWDCSVSCHEDEMQTDRQTDKFIIKMFSQAHKANRRGRLLGIVTRGKAFCSALLCSLHMN